MEREEKLENLIRMMFIIDKLKDEELNYIDGVLSGIVAMKNIYAESERA